jgi:hypothetical protein
LNLIPRVITSKIPDFEAGICGKNVGLFQADRTVKQYVVCIVNVMYVDNKYDYTGRHILKDE